MMEGAIEAEAHSGRVWDGKFTLVYDREGFSIRENLDKELLRACGKMFGDHCEFLRCLATTMSF
jgi:hypothetical protein